MVILSQKEFLMLNLPKHGSFLAWWYSGGSYSHILDEIKHAILNAKTIILHVYSVFGSFLITYPIEVIWFQGLVMFCYFCFLSYLHGH